MGSFDKLHGHVSEIERRNKELGGFLTLFAKLPRESQDRIMSEVARLKKELSNNPETFLMEVRALAVMYGAMEKKAEGRTGSEIPTAFTAHLGDIVAATAELRKTRGSETRV